MIVFNCPQCNLELKVKPEHAGQSGNCRHCGTKLRVPSKGTSDKAGSAGAAAPVENVEFESVQGFDDIAANIADQYDPEEEPVEKEEEDTGSTRRRGKGQAAAKEGPTIRPIYLLFPVLIAMAFASWFFFMSPPVDEPIPEMHRLPQQELDQAMNYLTNESLFPNVAWVDTRPEEGVVVVGWRRVQNIPGGEVPPKRVVNNAATIASDALRARASVYLIDADRFTETWTLNQGGVIDQATAEDGMVVD